MFKKVALLIMVIFLLVFSSFFVSGGGVYTMTDGTTTLSNIRVDGTLNWRITFKTEGAESGANQPELTVSPSGITLNALASWNDQTGNDACSVLLNQGWSQNCGGWDWTYYPAHYIGSVPTSIIPVSDGPGTYTFYMRSYGDGITNSELSSYNGGYDCGPLCTRKEIDSSTCALYGGQLWQVILYECTDNPNTCTNSPYPASYAWQCNGVSAQIEFFDDANPEGTINSNDNWPVTAGSGGTKVNYDAWGVRWTTDTNPGALVEVQQNVVITEVCQDDADCNGRSSGNYCESDQEWSCSDTSPADGCFDTVTPTPCGICSACSIGSCVDTTNGLDPINECNGVDCSAFNYYHGWVSGTCYYKADELAGTHNCDGNGVCRTAAQDCPGNGQGDTTGVSRTLCRTEVGCTGTTGPSLGFVAGGADTYNECNGLSCSNYYGNSGTEGPYPGDVETCYDRANELAGTHNCDGNGVCRTAAQDCPTNSLDTVMYSCGACKYIAGTDCTGTTLGSCTNYPQGTICGSGMECDNSGNCVVAYEDCGLRIRNTATQTAVIACAPEGAGSSLKIRGSGGTTYNVVLVPTTDSMASNARVQTSSGTMALRCLYSGCLES